MEIINYKFIKQLSMNQPLNLSYIGNKQSFNKPVYPFLLGWKQAVFQWTSLSISLTSGTSSWPL